MTGDGRKCRVNLALRGRAERGAGRLIVIALGVLSCLAIPLLPRHAQPAGPH